MCARPMPTVPVSMCTGVVLVHCLLRNGVLKPLPNAVPGVPADLRSHPSSPDRPSDMRGDTAVVRGEGRLRAQPRAMDFGDQPIGKEKEEEKVFLRKPWPTNQRNT